jgi:RNA polymerase sigma-70 factor (ECF subfamily)
VSDQVDGAAGEGADAMRRRELEAVYRAQAPGLVRFFRARFRGVEDPDDMVQEVFMRLARSKTFPDVRDPQAYLSRTLRNFLIDRKRRRDTSPDFVPLDGVEPALPPEQAHGIEVAQMQARYRAAVDALPPRTREVFVMHRGQELSVKIIAERLEISSRTVEWHLAQAILRIGEALERE